MNLRERRPRSSAGETQKSQRRVGPGWSLSGWDMLPEDRLWSGESGARVEVTGGCLWHVMTYFSDELLFLASAPRSCAGGPCVPATVESGAGAGRSILRHAPKHLGAGAGRGSGSAFRLCPGLLLHE